MTVPASAVVLLERDAELARIEERLRAGVEGSGSLLFLEGAAGIGKTALVRAAVERGRELGLEVLAARGSELERGFAYGVVRQLFEPVVLALGRRDRERLLAGAAARAAALFDVEVEVDGRDALLDPSFAVLHGLYWLCANLSRRSPLLLAVDDAHWSDHPSLRFLHFLASRVEELPIAVVVAARSSDTPERNALLDSLAAGAAPAVTRLAPLSEDAVGALVALRLGVVPDPAFVRACHIATGGVPFLVQELVREAAAAGMEPSATAAPRVAALAPAGVARSIALRLGRLSPDARELARATAVLGEVDLRLGAAFAGIDPRLAAVAADELVAAGLLEEGRPLRFLHPIVRAAVEGDLPPGERARRHADAARRLVEERAPPEGIASHLLMADPAGDDWVVESLRAAARSAVANGAPDSAVSYLRRALAEPPSDRLRQRVLLELGFAESYAGEAGAAERLEEALSVAEGVPAQVSITLALGRMLQIEGRNQEALEVFDRTVRRLAGSDRKAALALEGAALGAAQLDAETAPEAVSRIARLRRTAETESDVPTSVFGMLAVAAALANEPAETVARLALRALEGAPKLLPEAVDRPPFFYHACAALVFAERYEPAARRMDEAIADARRLGSLPHVLALSCYRAWLHLRNGALSEAEADSRTALETGPRPPGFHAALALAVLLDVLVERGELDAADEYDAALSLGEHFPTTIHAGWLLAARGHLRLAQSRPGEALDALLAAGGLFERTRALSPTVAPWRSSAALALHALDRRAEARALVAEELSLAQTFGGPRGLGVALRAAGLVEGGRRGIRLLGEAVRALQGSPAQLERARATLELGAALRRANRRAEGREVLRRALDLAHRLGALALVERARTELLAAGGRPRRLVVSGVEALTPSERRVAGMAASGLTNRQIAQQLFVTARTVESHLTHVYQKLGVGSRDELARVLAR